jgi:hypothetical protein
MPNARAAAWSQFAKGEQRVKADRAAIFEGARGFAKEGLGEKEAGVRAHGRQVGGAARRKPVDRADAEVFEQSEELILDDIGQRANDHQALFARRVDREFGDEGGEASVFAFGERRLDPRARIVEDAHAVMLRVQSLRSAAEVELDDFGGAGPDEE